MKNVSISQCQILELNYFLILVLAPKISSAGVYPGRHSGEVISSVTSQQEGPGISSRSGRFCVELACSVWVLSGYAGFLPQLRNMQKLGVRSNAHSKFPVSKRECVCLYMSALQ